MFSTKIREKNRTSSRQRIWIHSKRSDRKNRRFVLSTRRVQ